MSKTLKPNTARTPPIPSDDHSGIDEWIRQRVMPELSPMVRKADELICSAMNIVFFGGADFDDPPPLGETDRSRYVKLKTRAELAAPEVGNWINQAANVPGWK